MDRWTALWIVSGCLLVTAGCAALIGPPVEYPTIAPGDGQGEDVTVGHTVWFEDRADTVLVTVDGDMLESTRVTRREVKVRGSIPDGEWLAGAYRAQIGDPAQEPFFQELLRALREVRDRRGLDADRYLELLAATVQQLPYVAAPARAANYPVETWSDHGGDCDDKALLLAGLLSREGYRVALFVHLPESHMAVGVGCPPGEGWNGTGYAYLEVTNASYVGVVPERIGGGLHLASDPLVVPIGDGTATYGALAETAAIERGRQVARSRVDRLGPEIDRRTGALEADRRQLERLRAAGARDAFEREYAEYETETAAIDRLVDEHNRLVELLDRTAAARYDRVGATAYVSAYPP